MNRLGRVVAAGAALMAGTVMVGVSDASARSLPQQRQVPNSITCLAAETGLKGATGATGDTGATGPRGDTGVNPPNGVVRTAHLATPNCSSIPVVCVIPGTGVQGAVGLSGATGPKGDRGNYVGEGRPRIVHVRFPSACIGVPLECMYGVAPQGDTGPTGATGVKGPSGYDITGVARAPHRFVAGESYQPGATVTLSQCTLPNTGGRTSQVLQWAVTLIALGLAVGLVVRRRRTAV